MTLKITIEIDDAFVTPTADMVRIIWKATFLMLPCAMLVGCITG